jgi:Ku70/Ku80 N-terminal alpha/beta domain
MTKTDDLSSTIGPSSLFLSSFLSLLTLLTLLSSFLATGGPTSTCNLSDALWTASSLFSSVNKKFGTKRVFLFTNDDNPNKENAVLQGKSQQRAQDLFDLGIQIELFAVEEGGEEAPAFDVKKFYQEIISYSDVESFEEEGVCCSFDLFPTHNCPRPHKSQHIHQSHTNQSPRTNPIT